MGQELKKIGRYVVEDRLGEGGMGTVYLATDPTIGRRVAIKVLRTDDEEYRRRFKVEVSAAGALRHRNIITIYDSGEHEDGSPFLAMEYVPGETLGHKIARREPIALADKLRLVIELCEGLAHAHRAGIVHRDIKPANVIIDEDDESVRIVDFGIARMAAGGPMMTKSGMLVGTLTYMAPEQILGRSVDHRADIFAVGCVLYELLSYTRAFPGGLEDGLMYRIVHEEPAALDSVAPGIDPDLTAIVACALRKDPDGRYAHIKEMSASLASVRQRLLRDGQTIAKRPAGLPPPDFDESTPEQLHELPSVRPHLSAPPVGSVEADRDAVEETPASPMHAVLSQMSNASNVVAANTTSPSATSVPPPLLPVESTAQTDPYGIPNENRQNQTGGEISRSSVQHLGSSPPVWRKRLVRVAIATVLIVSALGMRFLYNGVRFVAMERDGTYRAFETYANESWAFDVTDPGAQAARYRMQLFRDRTKEVEEELTQRRLLSDAPDGVFGVNTIEALKTIGIVINALSPEDVNQNVPPCVLDALKGGWVYEFCVTSTPGLTLPQSIAIKR